MNKGNLVSASLLWTEKDANEVKLIKAYKGHKKIEMKETLLTNFDKRYR